MSNDDFTKPPVGNAMNPYSQAPPAAVVTGGAPRTSRLAVWSLVLGVLALICNIFTGVIGFILGIVALVKINGSNGKLKGTGFAIAGIACSFLFSILGLIALLLPAVQQVRQAARRTMAANNIRALTLAHFNYESAYAEFPAISGNSKGEGTGLSWRVHLLPYLEENALYKQFHLDEPWDSPHNKSLLDQMPVIYESPAAGPLGQGLTVYLRPVGNGAFDDGDGLPINLRDMTDGSTNTILMVEANSSEAVPWTKPDDYDFDPANPTSGLGEYYPQIFVAGMGDGSTRSVYCGQGSSQEVKAMFTKSGGEVINIGP